MKLLAIIFVLLLVTPSYGQITAVTEEGEIVELFQDGTWRKFEQLEFDITPHVMEVPAFNGATLKGGQVVNKVQLISSEANQITDDEKWFEDNDLSLPEYTRTNDFTDVPGNLPSKVPENYKGAQLHHTQYSDSLNFLVYGEFYNGSRYLLITDKNVDTALHLIDFGNYMLSPEYQEENLMFIGQDIKWVHVEDSILYVTQGHNTYASSSNNMNAYITAINLNNYEVIWRSKPLINNAYSFEVYGDIIICGYGFSKEPDFLYTLIRATGEVAQKIPLKTGPSHIIRKEDKIHVRTYNMNYVFQLK